MDPQELLFVDKRVTTAIRNCGLAFSLILATVSLLVYYRLLDVPTAYTWAAWPLAVDLVLLGVLQKFWNPYTREKVRFYVDTYVWLGSLLTILVIGFSTLIFFGWLIIIMIMDIYFSRRRAAVGFGIMLASLAIWIFLHYHTLGIDDISGLLAAALAVAAVELVVSAIWRLTNESVRKMHASVSKQDLEHNQLTSLINSMADGVIAVDGQAKVLLYNAAALNVLDINSSMQRKSIGQFIKLLDKEQQPIDVVELITNAKIPTTSRDYRLKYSDGSVVNLYFSIAPVHLGYGKGGTQGFVLMLRDITHEKSLEEERDEFISVVSHELRTPIAISEGNISNAQFIAEHDPKPEQLKKALEEAHNQVLFLADMINDLATLSRAERGKLTLELEDITLQDFVEELTHNYTADADKKGLKFSSTIDPALTTLSSSKLYVREILQNFITNAIKYTEKGGVKLTAKPKDGGILFEVSDTGIGISKADQERVFDKFFRSEDYRTRQHNGTGLGLYVTMKLARIVHADISVESELNKGSTFSIFIPNLAATPDAPDSTKDKK